MLLKLKAFYLPFTETQAESLKKPKEDKEVKENKEYLNELRHYVLDNAKLTDDVKEKIENSVLNDNKEDFDMNKIAKYLSDNLDDANSKTTIVAWQIILKKHGLYKGKIDGINGPLTKKAIDEFKEKSLKDNENKIDVNSEFNKALIHTYCAERTISVEEQKSDTDGKKDKNFVNNLLTVLKSFDSKNDMLVLSVNQSKETNNDRKDQSKDDYDNLGAYYEGTNHAISVEKVITDDQENPTIVVSNPWDSGRVYNIKFKELIKKSNAFQLCTKEERNLTQYRGKGNGEGVRRDAASSNIDKVDEAKTVNQIVEITGDVNEKLREARGDIIVENIGENKITVKSYNQTRQVEQSKGKIIIGSGDKKLSIPESEISDTFGEESNSIYRLYLYGAKIANMINFIENKYDKNDDFYLNKEGILQYDRVGPINTDILKDRSQLGISKNKTKKDFVNYLGTLGYKCKIALK